MARKGVAAPPGTGVRALDHVLIGLPLTNVDYRAEADIASPTATQDLMSSVGPSSATAWRSTYASPS